MARAERQYSRIYYDDLQRDYPHVWDNDGGLAAFDRLLALADKMWPTLPELPRSVRRSALAVLTQPNATGNALVEIVRPHSYRIRGHHADRLKRQHTARNAADVRWQNERNADADADAMPRQAETSKAEISPPPQVGRRKDRTNPRALGTNPRANGNSPRQVKAAEKRGGAEILGAIVDRTYAEFRPVPKPGKSK